MDQDWAARARAADYVRPNPGCIQSNVTEHIMCGRSYGWARRIHWADARSHGFRGGKSLVDRRCGGLFIWTDCTKKPTFIPFDLRVCA